MEIKICIIIAGPCSIKYKQPFLLLLLFCIYCGEIKAQLCRSTPVWMQARSRECQHDPSRRNLLRLDTSTAPAAQWRQRRHLAVCVENCRALSWGKYRRSPSSSSLRCSVEKSVHVRGDLTQRGGRGGEGAVHEAEDRGGEQRDTNPPLTPADERKEIARFAPVQPRRWGTGEWRIWFLWWIACRMPSPPSARTRTWTCRRSPWLAGRVPGRARCWRTSWGSECCFSFFPSHPLRAADAWRCITQTAPHHHFHLHFPTSQSPIPLLILLLLLFFLLFLRQVLKRTSKSHTHLLLSCSLSLALSHSHTHIQHQGKKSILFGLHKSLLHDGTTTHKPPLLWRLHRKMRSYSFISFPV